MRGVSRPAALAAALMTLAGCSRNVPDVPTEPKAPAAKTAAPVAAAPTAVVRPEGADAVDAALKAAQEYTTASTAELTGIESAQARIHAAAERAAGAAARGDSRGVTAARGDAERARQRLSEGLAALRASAATQTAALDAAVALCATTPELAAYEGCVAIAAEPARMAQAIAALDKGHRAAEAAYPADRARLDEASASVALAGGPR